MRICGIIAEYNPFHSGHARHISLARQASGTDFVICAMSGSFVQRGEPAIFDKWTRTACALAGGADAVIELPLLTAIQSAEGFASGGVKLLAAAGVTDLCFGCETDDIVLLTDIAKTVADENESFRALLKQSLSAGSSYAKARALAADAPHVASLPGAILGIEYIKAILRAFPDIRPHAVIREGADYHSEDIAAHLPSATAIRKALFAGQTNAALKAMPAPSADIVAAHLTAGLKPVFAHAFDLALLHTLRLSSIDRIKLLPDVSEGLENRILAAAQVSQTRDELIDRIKTKRYTYTRISRILLYALLGITRDMIKMHNAAPTACIRVLGARNTSVMSLLSEVCSVPLVTSAASPLYPAIDAAVSGVWALTQTHPPYNAADRDFTERLMI